MQATKAVNLQAEDVFVLKVTQLREILSVRWSVFVIGPAGCGKTELIRVLSKAENLFGEKSTINVLNPKSVTRNELYGYIHPATREWKDGLLSQIFRDLANCHTVKHEYLLLDGDIDAEWIESMNTVMDDNKTLTLASNERIPLMPPMRLLLEIENMSQVCMHHAHVVHVNWRVCMYCMCLSIHAYLCLSIQRAYLYTYRYIYILTCSFAVRFNCFWPV